MIKAKTNSGKSLNIPNVWSDISVYTYSEVLKNSDNQTKILSLLTGLTESEVEKLDVGSRNLIVSTCSFIQRNFDPSEWIIPEKVKVNYTSIDPRIDIKTKTFGQKIELHSFLSEKDIDIIQKILTTIEIYFQPILTSKPYDPDLSEAHKYMIARAINLPDAFAIQQNYTKQLFDILETEATQLKKKPTQEQLRAGIDMFNEFGVMNIVDTLAGGDVLKYEDILNLEYNVVFLKLRKSLVESIYQENYKQILTPKPA